jgi:transmembrane sensor
MMVETEQDAGELSPLDREAHAWVRRLTSGEATATDATALRLWCGRSPAHAAAFSAASQFWQALGPVGESLAADERAALARPRFARPGIMGRRAFIGGALAASAAGVLIARPPLGLWPSYSELQADFRTGAGERRQISVTDGLSIDMNARTSISIATDAIELIAGEASFAMPDDSSKRFSVVAGTGRTSAVNAHFDVRHTGAMISVTCLANEVQVEHPDRTIMLRPRQQVNYRPNAIEDVVTIDPAVVSAWQRGLMIFNMTPLAEVIDELNRYRSGRIVLMNASLAQSPVNGQFKIDRPDDALAQIELGFGVRRRTLPGGLILLS